MPNPHDTKPVPQAVPFLKTKELRHRLDAIKKNGASPVSLLEHILRSLAAGRTDDPKAAAVIAFEIVTEEGFTYSAVTSRGAVTGRLSAQHPNIAAAPK